MLANLAPACTGQCMLDARCLIRSDLPCFVVSSVQALAVERDTWRQQFEVLRDRKLRDSGQVESQAQVWRCNCIRRCNYLLHAP